MRKLLTKLTSVMLALALLISITPTNAYLSYADSLSNSAQAEQSATAASSISDEQPSTSAKKATGSSSNPEYKGLDIKTYSPSTTSPQRAAEFYTKEAAAEYLKQQMVNRAGTISFTLNQSYYSQFGNDLLNLAFEDNAYANSSEGDYLYGNWYSARWECTYWTSPAKVNITFYMNYLSTYSQELAVDREVDRVLNQLNVYNRDTYTKVKSVHDYIAKNINYDYSLSNYSAYNAIVDKNVVCQGFATITYKMLKELGVGVRFITGIGNGGAHAWNIVKLGNLWYNTDNTWDENLTTWNSISYDYFLKGSYYFPNHTRDSKYNTYTFNSEFPTSTSNYVYTGQKESTLKLSNYNYPTSVVQGHSFTLKGTISSNYLVDYVAVSIFDEYGNLVSTSSKEVYPYSYSYSNIDSGIKFGTLNAGRYTYQIAASDESCGTKVLLSKSFIVTKPSKTVSNISGLKYTNTTSSIKLSWSKPTYATGYEIWRYKADQDTYSKVKTITSKSTNYYSVSSLPSATMYRYKVRAYRTVNGVKYYGKLTDEFITATKPLTPTLTVTAGTRKATLKWTNTSSRNTGYQVYRATSKTGTYTRIKTTTSKTYTNTGLTKGKYYYYKVRAYRTLENGQTVYGSYSSIKSVKAL